MHTNTEREREREPHASLTLKINKQTYFPKKEKKDINNRTAL